jgi:predicted RNA-binding Zn-ribbon protein involved in translation (DUF1610 family)
MKQLNFNFTDTSWDCVSCGEFIKPDEWCDYDKKMCIDCGDELWNEWQSACADQ